MSDVKNHLLDLIFIMISNGGDVNIRDEFSQGLLHRVVALPQNDMRLLELLIESNCDLNAADHKGNTPLLSLCDMQMDYSNDKLASKQLRMLNYLMAQESILLDIANKCDRTALFNCMLRGNIPGAQLLLAANADPSICGKVKSVDEDAENEFKFMSPLFALLCSPIGFQFNQVLFSLYISSCLFI